MRSSSSLGEPQKPGGVGWTWIASAPIALARSNDRCSPPDESTWAPITGTQRDYVLKRPVLEGLASSRPGRPGAYGAEAGVASCARSVTHLHDALPRVLVGSLAPAADAAKSAADLGVDTLAMPDQIKFGTDGWRGVVADDFTFANVRRVAKGSAEYMLSLSPAPLAVVGYDSRFAAEDFARTVADVFAASGVRSLIFDRPSPTQVASWTVIDRKATAAAVVTASHNPYLFNGIKFKTETGSSASPDVIAELEPRINALDSVPVPDRSASGEMVSVYDPRAPYYAQIGRMVDLNAIKSAGLHIVHECMHGSGYGYIKELLEGGRTDVVELHSDRNPLFGGVNPEPIPPNIDSSIAYMRGGGHDLCICTDGDADRVGIIDETGRFINQLQVFALLMLYLFDIRHMVGPVVKTVNMTSMVDKLGAEFGVPVYEVPVGFKN